MKRFAMLGAVMAMTLATTTTTTAAFGADNTTPASATSDTVGDATSSTSTNSTNKATPSIHRSRSGQPSRVTAASSAPAASASSAPQTEAAPPLAVPTPVPPAAASASAATTTPLTTRPTTPPKPLTLAPTNESAPFAYKLLAGIGIAAAAGLWLRKRSKNGGKRARTAINVMGRTSVGVRSELLVVDVEGTRLLIGMTPSAIQTLAVLDAPALSMVGTTAAEQAADVEEEERLNEIALRRRQPAASSPPPPPTTSIMSKKKAPQAGASSDVEELSHRVRSLLAARKSMPNLKAQVDPDKYESNIDEDGDNAIIAQRPSFVAAQRTNTGAFDIPRRRSSMNLAAVNSSSGDMPMPARRRSSMNLAAVSPELLDETQSRRLSPKTSAIAGQAKGLLLALEEESVVTDVSVNPPKKSIRLGDW